MFGRKARLISELEARLTEETDGRERMSMRVAALVGELHQTRQLYERRLEQGRAGHANRLKKLLAEHARDLQEVREAAEQKLRQSPTMNDRELRAARAALEIVRPIIEAVRTAAPRLEELTTDDQEEQRRKRLSAAAVTDLDSPVDDGAEPFGGRFARKQGTTA